MIIVGPGSAGAITANQLKYFFTKVSTKKASATFAHSLGGTPAIAIVSDYKGGVAWTFGTTNVIVSHSKTTQYAILAIR